ncbi:response regulator transcription factor [Mariniflexile maritimum]|uniref:response regulator transcription factor n=1 Tax=Mariniflexile maritimum TaxID=2682493 RepID=UPI0012F66513|nr:LuxR C-terminal-related transcriptional regulator [Mariniflexile maritimum]
MEIKKLSKRELAVLKLIQKGYKNKTISKELGLNEKTVSTYVARIKKKLNVPLGYNSHYMVSKAVKLKILEEVELFD